jgi:hypothetical protein
MFIAVWIVIAVVEVLVMGAFIWAAYKDGKDNDQY